MTAPVGRAKIDRANSSSLRGRIQGLDRYAPTAAARESSALSADGKSSVSTSRLRRGLLAAAGILCVGLGMFGVVLPLLPTTPFLLLAAACFLRSSERLHRWLLGNRVFGEYLRRYRDGEGLTVASKVTTLVLLWTTLALSAFTAVPSELWWVRLILLAVGIGVTIHIVRIKTLRRRDGGKTSADQDRASRQEAA